jgi:hypothetical protein
MPRIAMGSLCLPWIGTVPTASVTCTFCQLLSERQARCLPNSARGASPRPVVVAYGGAQRSEGD